MLYHHAVTKFTYYTREQARSKQERKYTPPRSEQLLLLLAKRQSLFRHIANRSQPNDYFEILNTLSLKAVKQIQLPKVTSNKNKHMVFDPFTVDNDINRLVITL